MLLKDGCNLCLPGGNRLFDEYLAPLVVYVDAACGVGHRPTAEVEVAVRCRAGFRCDAADAGDVAAEAESLHTPLPERALLRRIALLAGAASEEAR